MTFIITTVLVFGVACCYGTTLPVEHENFLYMGSFKPTGLASVADFDPFNYYVSITVADWSTARRDCQQIGGDLLSVSTQGEADWVAGHLEEYGSGVFYWTAGQVQTQTFVFWANNGQLVPIWLKWSPNHPPANSHSRLRVKINHINQFFSFYEVDNDTKPLRYICKR